MSSRTVGIPWRCCLTLHVLISIFNVLFICRHNKVIVVTKCIHKSVWGVIKREPVPRRAGCPEPQSKEDIPLYSVPELIKSYVVHCLQYCLCPKSHDLYVSTPNIRLPLLNVEHILTYFNSLRKSPVSNTCSACQLETNELSWNQLCRENPAL